MVFDEFEKAADVAESDRGVRCASGQLDSLMALGPVFELPISRLHCRPWPLAGLTVTCDRRTTGIVTPVEDKPPDQGVSL